MKSHLSVPFLLTSVFLLLFQCCSTNAEKSNAVSFYYWRTTFHLSAKEKEALSHFNTKDLYLRFFDVDKSENDSLEFCGEISLKGPIPDSVNVTPVVFITNRSFLNADSAFVKKLALKISSQVKTISEKNKIALKKLQLDCDWSVETKKNYFFFLKEMKRIFGNDCLISSTIRLHQVKFPEVTGVPPVDEGTLMFYNMGNVKDEKSENSIFNKSTAEKYTARIIRYPLPLSYALPIFGWTAQYRNGKLINLIAKKDGIEAVNKTKVTEKEKGRRYQINSSFLQGGNYFMEGDELKVEKLSAKELAEAAKLLAPGIKEAKRKIIFYDLDEYNLNTYSYEDFEKILEPFH